MLQRGQIEHRVPIWSTTKRALMTLAMAVSEERQGQRPECSEVSGMWESRETVAVNYSFRSLTLKGRLENWWCSKWGEKIS